MPHKKLFHPAVATAITGFFSEQKAH